MSFLWKAAKFSFNLAVSALLCLSVAFLLPLAPAPGQDSPAPDNADPVLRGILDLGGRTVFSLGATDGTGASWVELGGRFRGHTLVDYDARHHAGIGNHTRENG